MENFVLFFNHLNPFWIYAALFAIAYIENIFPPAPSDLMIVAGGSLIGLDRIDFFPALLFATLGSTAGFVTMYKIGEWFGTSIVERGRWKFIPRTQIHQVEGWFQHYGNWLIVANRFLSGTRAVISVFAGLSGLNLGTTTLLSFISSLLWNGILVYAGLLLGKNWSLIGLYLATYSQFVTAGLVVFAIGMVIFWFYKRNHTP